VASAVIDRDGCANIVQGGTVDLAHTYTDLQDGGGDLSDGGDNRGVGEADSYQDNNANLAGGGAEEVTADGKGNKHGAASQRISQEEGKKKKICGHDDCIKSAEGRSSYCIAHGGGKRLGQAVLKVWAPPQTLSKWSQLESRASGTSRPQLKKSKTDSPPPLGDCWKLWVFSEILKVFNERRERAWGRQY